MISKLQTNFEKYDDWMTRTITMEVLGHFALQDEALRAYVVPKLEALKKERSVSLSTRARKILKQLESRS
ncbi:MAG: hypothetical protein ACXWPS_10120 [Ktedonobacteraceae bacterium]